MTPFSSKKLNFQMFFTSRNCHFRQLLGGFAARTPYNVVNFVWNFDQWWHARWYIRYATVFIEVLGNAQSQAKKLIFLVHFESFPLYTFLYPMSYVPRFCQMKELIKVYICGKFHQYSICGCEIKNFDSFSYWFSICEMAPFGGFCALTPTNIVQSIVKYCSNIFAPLYLFASVLVALFPVLCGLLRSVFYLFYVNFKI